MYVFPFLQTVETLLLFAVVYVAHVWKPAALKAAFRFLNNVSKWI